MSEIELPPSAAKLLESMRDIGYSFQSALADIIDNSISAEASTVRVVNGLDDDDAPYVAVLDNGYGMSGDELTAAMQHGSRSPREERAKGDLGRFGLGLKTASFSQCRRLTVVSRKAGHTEARQWDLDRVIESDRWLLRVVSPKEQELLPQFGDLGDVGTAVIWQKLDRLDAIGDKPDQLQEALNSLFHEARRHLAITFHRFLEPEQSDEAQPIEISINGLPVVAEDPFARHTTPRSDSHEVETLVGPLGTIVTQAFTLPHHSRLSLEQLEKLALGSSLVETQGLYIYREKRLIVGGTWLGLAPRSEISKLLRVRVDVPTTLDSDWGVDVRKSKIRPPASVRNRLKPLVQRMTESAKRPYTYRGSRQATGSARHPVWLRVDDRGAIRYTINREHPLVERLVAADPALSSAALGVLTAVEASLPLETIFSDIGDSPKRLGQGQVADQDLETTLVAYLEALAANSDSISRSVATLILTSPPFGGDPRAEAILKKLRMIVDT